MARLFSAWHRSRAGAPALAAHAWSAACLPPQLRRPGFGAAGRLRSEKQLAPAPFREVPLSTVGGLAAESGDRAQEIQLEFHTGLNLGYGRFGRLPVAAAIWRYRDAKGIVAIATEYSMKCVVKAVARRGHAGGAFFGAAHVGGE